MPETSRNAWRPASWLAEPSALAAWQAGSAPSPFVHPSWLSAWWATHGVDGTEVHVWVGRGDTHSADAPPSAYCAWLRQARTWPPGLTVRRLQLLGQADWIVDSFPGEYAALGGAADDGVALQALDAALDLGWDELLLLRVPSGGVLARAASAWSTARGLYAVTTPRAPAWCIETDGSRAAQRAALHAGERRALFGPAARARVRYVATGGTLDELYRLHDLRWAGAGMPVRVRRFLDALQATPAAGLRLRVSLLLHEARPCSARLLLECGDTTYDLQSGFDASAVAGASLGKLHLGYELERAFDDPATRRFDLLAGHGMREDYKARLAARPVALCDIRVVRAGWLRFVRGVQRWRGPRRARVSARTPGGRSARDAGSRSSRARRTLRGGARR